MFILQRTKSSGGLGLPNFKFWSFSLFFAVFWLNSDAWVAWHPLEEKLVSPHRLQDIIYSNVSLKTCRSQFGPIISHFMATWRLVENHANISLKCHPYLHFFNNFVLCLGGQPIHLTKQRDKGINTLYDIISNNIMRTFQDVKIYILPSTSFFFIYNFEMFCVPSPWGEELKSVPKICQGLSF